MLSSIFGPPKKKATYEELRDQEIRDQVRRESEAVMGPNHDAMKLWSETSEAIASADFPQADEFRRTVLDIMFQLADERGLRMPHTSVATQMMVAAESLYVDEALHDQLAWPVFGGIEGGKYRDDGLRTRAKVASAGKTLGTLRGSLGAAFLILTKHLPTLALDSGDTDGDTSVGQTIPLIELLPNIGKAIEEMLLPMIAPEIIQGGLFRKLRSQLEHNQARINEHSRSKTSISPADFNGDAQETVRAYLGATPLEQIFYAQIPFNIFLEDRLEHTAIIAGSGWGKTQLLQHIIAGDVSSEQPPAMVVLDSTGAMVQRIQRLAVFNDRLKDRLLIIDPELDPVPALNPFDVANERFERYSPNEKERLQTEIIDLFNYVFSTVNNPLTTRMQTAFAFMVRLLLSIPNANIHTLLALLDDDPPKGDYDQATFKQHIDKLDPTSQHFFKVQYYTGRDGGLREQIRARVFDILRVPAFERMFTGVNKVDFFAEMNKGTIIVVNTSENLLKAGSATFGRYIIARVMAAAFERAPIPPDHRRPAFLIVDEAAQYFDETFDTLLNRVRQFKLGVVIAFQNTQQANDKLKASIASSTAVKYAGGTSFEDARWLAREMRCDADFILAQKRDGRPPKWAQFACYVRNFTGSAVSLTVPFFTLESMPQMTPTEHQALLTANRARVSAPQLTPEQEAALKDVADIMVEMLAPEALAKAKVQLAEAIANADWAKAGELQHKTIPDLELIVAKLQAKQQPRPAAASVDTPRPTPTGSDVPRPAATDRDDAGRDQAAKDWQ
jgi:hypothetical protein